MTRRLTRDIIEQIVSAINYTFTASSVVDNLDETYTLFSCNTLHLQAGYDIVIDGNDYTIISVNNNVSILIGGASVPLVKTFQAYQPTFKAGTIITTNIELDKTNDANEILPMIYLREVFEETFFNNDNINDRESPVEIFFLTQSDHSSTEDELLNYGVKPMFALAQMFIEMLNKHKDIGKIEDYNLTNWLRFGFEAQNGATKKIFNYCDMSGVQMRITIPFSRNLSCCKN
jgi:hypothetical protein